MKRDNNLRFWTNTSIVIPNTIDPITCQPKKLDVKTEVYEASIEIYEEFHYPDKEIQFPTWMRFKGRLGIPKRFPKNFPYRQSFSGELNTQGGIMVGRVQLLPQHHEIYRTSRYFNEWLAGYFYFEALKEETQ